MLSAHKGIAHHLAKGAYDFGLSQDASRSEEFKALRAFIDERRK
jgi:hypothetical protein